MQRGRQEEMKPADVLKTLKKKGQAMTLTRNTGGTFDPVTGANAGGSVSTFTVYGITLLYNSTTKPAEGNAQGTLIQSGDKQAMIAAGVTVPTVGDTLTVMGVPWVFVAVDDFSPSGVTFFYKCQIRI